MDNLSTGILERLGGTPKEIADELRAFSKSAQLLSDERENLLGEYHQKWVCIYQGDVAAHAETLDGLMDELDLLEISASNSVIRFIDKNQIKMIL